MENKKEKSFDELVEQYLGRPLPQHLTGILTLSSLPIDAQEYIQRMLMLMKQADYSVTQFNPILLWWLSFTLPNMLPRAWGGRIPPITLPGRHKKMDDYVTKKRFPSKKKTHIFLDIGCGFPPVTTLDTAVRLPDWQIIGIDQSFADYIIYDKEGHYACFDQKGKFQYFQLSGSSITSSFSQDPEATELRFNQFFSDLYPLLKNSNSSEIELVEKNGVKLIHNQIHDFEKSNLQFIQSPTLNLKIAPAKVCRMMNMLVYFKPDKRRKILNQAKKLVENDGLIISGTNGLGAQSRYSIYTKKPKGLSQNQFAFSLDNLGHLAIMPWFTIQENDPEAMMLAKFSSAIRSDRNFWPKFSNRLDELLEQHEICKRESNGFLTFPNQIMPIEIYFEKMFKIWLLLEKEEYAYGAADALVRAGFTAWENSVGDISVKLLENGNLF